jgi:hypothetical protein
MRPKIVRQECGCEIGYESISRSLFVREYWHKLCSVHDAEEKAYRDEAQRCHREDAAIRSLTEELT